MVVFISRMRWCRDLGTPNWYLGGRPFAFEEGLRQNVHSLHVSTVTAGLALYTSMSGSCDYIHV